MLTFEPGHSIFYKIAYAPSKDSDLRRPPGYALVPWLPTVTFEDSDQTARMRRLICVFAVLTYSLLGSAI